MKPCERLREWMDDHPGETVSPEMAIHLSECGDCAREQAFRHRMTDALERLSPAPAQIQKLCAAVSLRIGKEAGSVSTASHWLPTWWRLLLVPAAATAVLAALWLMPAAGPDRPVSFEGSLGHGDVSLSRSPDREPISRGGTGETRQSLVNTASMTASDGFTLVGSAGIVLAAPSGTRVEVAGSGSTNPVPASATATVPQPVSVNRPVSQPGNPVDSVPATPATTIRTIDDGF